MTTKVKLFSLVLLVCICHVSSSIKCHGGTPTLGKLTAPTLTTTCGVNGLEDTCHVMFTDYDNDNYDAWTYGCLIKGSLDKCDQSFKANGVTNNYCCCTTPMCNDESFAEKCKGGSSHGLQNVASFIMVAVLLAIVKLILY